MTSLRLKTNKRTAVIFLFINFLLSSYGQNDIKINKKYELRFGITSIIENNEKLYSLKQNNTPIASDRWTNLRAPLLNANLTRKNIFTDLNLSLKGNMIFFRAGCRKRITNIVSGGLAFGVSSCSDKAIIESSYIDGFLNYNLEPVYIVPSKESISNNLIFIGTDIIIHFSNEINFQLSYNFINFNKIGYTTTTKSEEYYRGYLLGDLKYKMSQPLLFTFNYNLSKIKKVRDNSPVNFDKKSNSGKIKFD
jgi:hypothetical protein